MFGIGTTEMIIILVLGLLLFGSRLPGIGRAFGKTIVEFKKGMAGIDEEVDAAVQRQAQARNASQGNLPPGQQPGVATLERRVSTQDQVEP